MFSNELHFLSHTRPILAVRLSSVYMYDGFEMNHGVEIVKEFVIDRTKVFVCTQVVEQLMIVNLEGEDSATSGLLMSK